MDIQKIMTLNKEHLSLATRKMLQNEPKQFSFIEVYKKAIYGWILYIDEERFYDAIRYGKYPGDLKAVISFALQSDCKILCLDEHANVLMCLPHYTYRYHVPVTGGNPGETCTVEEIWYGASKISHNCIKA